MRRRSSYRGAIDLFDDPPWGSPEDVRQSEAERILTTTGLGTGLEVAIIATSLVGLGALLAAFYLIPWTIDQIFSGFAFP